VQSDKLTVKDPEFRAAVEDVTGRLSQVQYVKNVQSPLTGDSEVSADGHAALVGFEIAGDSTEAADRVDPRLATVAAAQAKHRPSTSSSSAEPAPTRRSTGLSMTTSRRPGCSPCRSR
jgi:hypothetical protein